MKPEIGLIAGLAALALSAPAAAEPLEIFNNRSFIQVTVNGRPVTALLDSAAEMTIIDDGLVHITELGRDYFHFDAGRHALIGERSGLTFQLAGRLRVKVARVDLEQAKIDFTLAEDAPTAPTPERRPVFVEPLSRDSRPAKGKARR